MRLTADQERAVRTEGTDLCVLAGAGSGKTRVLIERTAHLVLREEDPVPLSSFLAITFTEKAAREMKQRLARRFEASGRADARSEVEWAYVSTIHGFCSRLLRENAIEAGVDPGFSVLDEVQAGTLLREVLGRVAARWSRDRPEDYEEILRLGIPGHRLAEDLLDFLVTLRAAGVRPESATVPEPDPDRVLDGLDAIRSALAGVEELLPDLPGKSRARAEAVLAVRGALDELVARPDEVASFPAVGGFLDELLPTLYLNVSKDLKEILRPLKEEVVPFVRAEAATGLARPSLLALRELLAEVDARFGAEKEDLGALDFTDLEAKAHRLLADCPEVREAVRDRFSQILVDEYQDVNPVQARVIGLLRRPGNHVAVGDVKQSIYGFRHAEPAIFRARAEEAGDSGRIVLSDNFRSSPGLVEFANHCFGRLFRDDALVEFSDMVAAADYAPAKSAEVEILLTAGESVAEAREAEALAIARRIRALVDDGEISRRRAGEDRGRPVGFGDVALLFRTLSDVKLYERAFEELDVPFHVVKGRGFFQAREMTDLVRLLSSVANPRDEISLAAALRSPFGGLSDDGLLALVLAVREAGREARLGDLLDGASRPPGLSPRDREAFDRFRDLHARLRWLAARGTIREVIGTAVDGSGYGTSVWMQKGGRRRAANLRKVLALADSFEGLFDLATFLETLDDFRAREVRETEAPTGGEQEDVVRILTIHAAKGLEFPVVFLPDLSRRPIHAMPALLSANGAIAARISAEPGSDPIDTADYVRMKEERAEREEAERLRLLYVGVTRAEEMLVLGARAEEGEPPAGSFWASLLSVLDPEGKGVTGDGLPYGTSGRIARLVTPERTRPGPRRITVAGANLHRLSVPEPLTPPPPEARERAAALLARADRPRPAPDGTAYENTVSELLVFSACEACWYERFHLGLSGPWRRTGEEEGEREAGGEDELPPSERGTLVHEVLRLWDPEDAAALVDLVRRRTGGREALARDVTAMVRGFYKSEAGIEVRGAEEVRREVPFLVRRRLAGHGGMILRGQLDLVYRRADGTLRIVDYKTGRPGHRRYDIQLATYALALADLGEEKVEAAIAWLSSDGPATIEEVDLGEELLARVEERTEAFAARLAAGVPRPGAHAPGCTGSAPTSGATSGAGSSDPSPTSRPGSRG